MSIDGPEKIQILAIDLASYRWSTSSCESTAEVNKISKPTLSLEDRST